MRSATITQSRDTLLIPLLFLILIMPFRRNGVQRVLKRSYCLCNTITKKQNKGYTRTMLILHILVMTIARVARFTSDFRRGREVTFRHDFNFELHFRDIGPELFRRLYRVSLSQFRIMRDLLKTRLERQKKRMNYAGATPSVEAMLCNTLRILAGASYLDVRWPYGVGTPTTYTIFDETLIALDKVLPSLGFPTTETEYRFHAEKFRHIRNSPIYGIIAALDGIDIEISQPDLRDTPDFRKYYNRKGFYSICVQAAVGADYKFLFVSAGHASGTHDSTAFQATKLYDLLKENKISRWAIIAADDAYSNGVYILTPYSGLNLSPVQDTFNYYLSSCRITVEQAFGMLVSRFGIF